MIVLGLTGSIGMGKSSVCAMFETLGVPTHDADAAVHRLLEPSGAGYYAVAAAFPYYEYPDVYIITKGKHGQKTSRFNRAELGRIVFDNPDKKAELEAILHPLVRQDQARFIQAMRRMGSQIVVLDIPLLFETGGDALVDYTICVDAPYAIQRARVLSRPNMDEKKFHAILEKQMPNAEKCAMSDYVIPTGLGRAHTMACVKETLLNIKKTKKIMMESYDRIQQKGRRF
jgi:dephospho-CoA kinase